MHAWGLGTGKEGGEDHGCIKMIWKKYLPYNLAVMKRKETVIMYGSIMK